jgi:putative tryptophan/tyrosine transport system substrate-binding protein
MGRREFITVLCGAVAAGALAARAQESSQRMRRVGLLLGMPSDSEGQLRVEAFRQRLREHGWIEGQNVQIEARWATGDPARIREYAAELVSLAPDVIVGASSPVATALQQATKSIPIVFTVVNDMIGHGLAGGRPRSNLTGFTNFESSMGGKWIEILKQIAPRTARVALLFDPTNSISPRQFYAPSIEVVGQSLEVELIDLPIRQAADIERGLDNLPQGPNSGVVVLPDNTTVRHREQIVASMARRGLPAVYPYRYFVMHGGLVSYGTDTVELHRRAASYVDRILRGAKPADLPIQQPYAFELIINLKSAKALGLDIPPALLARANETRE